MDYVFVLPFRIIMWLALSDSPTGIDRSSGQPSEPAVAEGAMYQGWNSSLYLATGWMPRRRSKKEKKHEKKWYRRECVRHEKYESNRAWRGNARHARFEELRRDRLKEEALPERRRWRPWKPLGFRQQAT